MGWLERFAAAVLGNVVLKLVDRYVLDPAFRKNVDEAISLAKLANTEEEKLNASSKLQRAISS